MYLLISIDSFVIAVFFCLLTLAAINDVTDYRISNRLNLAIAALYPVHVLASPVSIDWIGGIIVGAVMFAIGALLFMLRSMGGGDVKLIVAASLWAGPAYLADFIAVTALSGGVMAVVLMSPLRRGLALAFDKCGNEHSRDAVLGKVLPYGLAIALGGYVVAFRLLALVQA